MLPSFAPDVDKQALPERDGLLALRARCVKNAAAPQRLVHNPGDHKEISHEPSIAPHFA